MTSSSMISISITDSKIAMKKIRKAEEYGAKAVQATCREFGTRAPAWISQGVREYYAIKNKDINADKKGYEKKGKIKVAGVSVDNIEIKYSGRVLTPTHFQMTPKKKPARRYTLKAAIKKGSKKPLGDRTFLAPAGGSGSQEIPFQRETSSRLPIKAVKTVSVPQMIANEKTRETIQQKIDENMAKRLDHHIERYAKRAQ